MHYLQQQGIPVTANNEVKLLMSGREKFLDLFEEIRHAKHHIHLEYFNFRNDSIANALFDLLAEKYRKVWKSVLSSMLSVTGLITNH